MSSILNDDPATLAEGEASTDFPGWNFIGGIWNNPSLNVEAETAIAVVFDVTQADTNTNVRVFDWNASNTNQITSNEYYLTDDPDSVTPLTYVEIPDGDTMTLYIVGPISSSDNAGVEFTAKNTGGTLTTTYVRQRYLNNGAATWATTTFNQLVNSNAAVGVLEQASIDYIFTPFMVAIDTPSESGKKIGEFWFGATETSKPEGVLLNGKTFNDAEYPELIALNLEFITDNTDGTHTIDWGNDFPRPITNTSALGKHVNNTTAANGLKGLLSRRYKTNTNSNGGAHRYSSAGNSANANVTITSTDAETAPDHRGVLLGIWAKV